MFRPVLNGRSIIQMIDPARDFRGMGRQVTRTCRHMRVMFSVENDASIQHRSIQFFETINFNYDFAFHDTALILLPSLDSFSIRFDYLSSLDYFVSMETLFARFEIESFRSGTREARLPLSFFLPFFSFLPLFFLFFNSDYFGTSQVTSLPVERSPRTLFLLPVTGLRGRRQLIMPIDRAGYRSGTVMHVNVRKDICFPFHALVRVHLCSCTLAIRIEKPLLVYYNRLFLPLAKTGI